MATGKVWIGTSGWHYDHWVGPFYPEGTSADRYLAHYVTRFRAVELNNTFYQLPEPSTLTGWRDATPSGFLFACKASRYTTHMKKLKDPEASTHRFFDAVDVLGDQLGPIVFQLPPHWGVDVERLRAFLEALPPGYRYAFEFRDPSWQTDAVFDLLRDHRAALCGFDLDGETSPIEVTADFAYLRLHGPDGPYRGRYDGRTLRGWARRMDGWRRDGVDVFCFFDNDEAGHAPMDAARLQAMLDDEAG